MKTVKTNAPKGPTWLDWPPYQWITIEEDPYNVGRWCVVIGGYVRARFSVKSEAEQLRDEIVGIFDRLKADIR